MTAATELRGKTREELEGELGGLYRERFNLRMQQGTGQQVRPHDHRRVRREIARIKTIINEKRSAGEGE